MRIYSHIILFNVSGVRLYIRDITLLTTKRGTDMETARVSLLFNVSISIVVFELW